MNTSKVTENSFEPGYMQLVRIIKDQVAAGDLRPGDRLPTEAQLCAYHGISPMTVHRAISLLSKDGIVTTKRGKGIFVKPIQFWQSTFQLGKLQYLFSENSNTDVKILGLRIIEADPLVSEKLKIKAGQKVIFIRRLISVNDKPFLYHREYLLYVPNSPIIESEMETTSLKGLFEGNGNHHFKNSVLTISAVNLEEEDARLLDARLNAAAFRLEHIFYNFENSPVSWGWFVCPGDRLQFSTVAGFGSEGGEIKNE